jgi:hypothetical protein
VTRDERAERATFAYVIAALMLLAVCAVAFVGLVVALVIAFS